MATHFSFLAWEIPWREEPGGLQSLESQRVRYNCATKQQHVCVLVFVKAASKLLYQFLFNLSITVKQSTPEVNGLKQLLYCPQFWVRNSSRFISVPRGSCWLECLDWGWRTNYSSSDVKRALVLPRMLQIPSMWLFYPWGFLSSTVSPFLGPLALVWESRFLYVGSRKSDVGLEVPEYCLFITLYTNNIYRHSQDAKGGKVDNFFFLSFW